MRGWRANNNFLDRGISIESNVLDPGQKRIFARKSQLFGDRMSGGRGRGEVENVNDTPTLLLFVTVCLPIIRFELLVPGVFNLLCTRLYDDICAVNGSLPSTEQHFIYIDVDVIK